MTTHVNVEPGTTPRPSFSRLNHVGLVLALLLGIGDCTAVFFPTPAGEVGPPFAILVLGTLLGVLSVVGVAWAWLTRARAAVRIVAAARVISAITALPAFFVDVPAELKLGVGAFVLVTVFSVVTMLTPARGAAR
ncbi:MAG: hypothetical protein WBQ50_05005 [Nocardioides sp.]